MSALLDTTVVIDVLRGDGAALSYLLALPLRATCSELTRVEVLRGVRSAERSAAGRFLDSLRWHAVDEQVAARAGELGRQYRRSHPGIGVTDLVIAATAQLSQLPLATSDVRHYPMFTELRRPY